MSHFTRIKTSIHDLSTLQSALTQLDIAWEKVKVPIRGYQNQICKAELVIPQQNSIDMGFLFNGKSYELVADKEFWRQHWSLELFLDKINQVYATQLLAKDLKNLGFSTATYVTSEEGVIDIVAEKW